MRRLQALMRKEFIHMRRDPRTLIVIFLMPVLELALLGFDANTDIKKISTAALPSRVSAFRCSTFKLASWSPSPPS